MKIENEGAHTHKTNLVLVFSGDTSTFENKSETEKEKRKDKSRSRRNAISTKKRRDEYINVSLTHSETENEFDLQLLQTPIDALQGLRRKTKSFLFSLFRK